MGDGWRYATLGTVATIEMGQSPPGSTYNASGEGLPFLQGSAEFGERYPAAVRWCAEPRKVARPGDILLSVRAPVGDLNRADQELAIGRGLAAIRSALPDVLTDYLAVALQEAAPEMRRRSAGTMFESINGSSLASQLMPLPPFAEQRRIVDLLVRLDTAATKAEAVAEQARTTADALRDDWFRSQTDTSLPLADVVEVTNGRLRSPKNASGPYMTRYIRTANVQDGRLVLDAPMYMNFSPPEQRKYALRVGDVLVTEGSGSRASIGAACRWSGEVAGLVCYQNHLVRLRPRPDHGLSESFIYQWALWAYRSGRFADIATGTNILSLGVERVAALRMPIGDAASRRHFVELAEAADLVEEAANQEVASLQQLRSALLGDLLSGAHAIPASYDRFLDGAA